MKAFFIITAACVLMLTGITLNSIYVRDFSESAHEQLSHIDFDSENRIEKLSDLTAFTQKHLKRIEFAVPHTKSSLIKDHLDLLNEYAKSGERSEFQKTRILLMNLLKEIGELEKTALFNIL